jgi:hypothetical protein
VRGDVCVATAGPARDLARRSRRRGLAICPPSAHHDGRAGANPLSPFTFFLIDLQPGWLLVAGYRCSIGHEIGL